MPQSQRNKNKRKLYQYSTKSWWEPPKMKVQRFSGVQSLNLYSDFSITIPFFVKCSKDGKAIYVRIASIKMTSKQKKSGLLELGVWVFLYAI